MVIVAVAGALLVVLAGLDVILTVLHPERRGPLTTAAGRGTFAAFRLAARAVRRRTVLGPAGAAAALVTVLTWVVALWLGWALVYLPFVDDLSYTPSVDYGDRNLWTALYFSGMSLSTVGYGDVVANTDALRILSVLESAAGFGVMTGAITYVLSLFPRVSNLRAASRTVQSQAEQPAQAATMVRDVTYLVAIHQQLTQIGEEAERFPVLFYFHAKDDSASLYTFIRGTTMLCLQARWGVSPDRIEHARRYGDELRTSVIRTVDHYAMRFMHTHGPEALDRPLDDDAARRLLHTLTSSAGDAGRDPAGVSHDELRELATFAGRCDTFLRHLAGQHLREHEPLTPQAARPTAG